LILVGYLKEEKDKITYSITTHKVNEPPDLVFRECLVLVSSSKIIGPNFMGFFVNKFPYWVIMLWNYQTVKRLRVQLTYQDVSPY